jgi:hypothetical protein
MYRGGTFLKTAEVMGVIATYSRPSRSRTPFWGVWQCSLTKPVQHASQSQSPQFDAGSISSVSVSVSGNASSPSLIPRGRYQSEVDGLCVRRRPRSNSSDEFGTKPRRS